MRRFSRIGFQSGSAARSVQLFVATLLLMLSAALPGQAQVRATLKGHTLALASVTYSPDGKFIATGSYDRTAKVWDATSGKELVTLTGHEAAVEAVAFSPDGKISGVYLKSQPRASPRRAPKARKEPQEGSGLGGVRSACRTEIAKLCPGEEHAGRCLLKHKDELSVECGAAIGQGH